MSITHLNIPLLRATTRLRYQRYIRRSIKGNEHHHGLFNSYNLKKINQSNNGTFWWTGNLFFRNYELKV